MTDVIALLESQHDQIEQLLDGIPRQMGSVREQSFLELRRLLAVHEAIEQSLVHPKAADEHAGAPGSRVHEEQDAAALLGTLESLDIESTEFETKFRGLRDAVLRHAEAEELTEFADLHGEFSPAELQRVQDAVAAAVGMPLLRESRMNHLGKLLFEPLYWHSLLPGRDLPGVGSTMPVHGKRYPSTRTPVGAGSTKE